MPFEEGVMCSLSQVMPKFAGVPRLAQVPLGIYIGVVALRTTWLNQRKIIYTNCPSYPYHRKSRGFIVMSANFLLATVAESKSGIYTYAQSYYGDILEIQGKLAGNPEIYTRTGTIGPPNGSPLWLR
jgi:hypothetical protein